MEEIMNDLNLLLPLLGTNLEKLKKLSVSMNRLRFNSELLTSVLFKVENNGYVMFKGAACWRSKNESFEFEIDVTTGIFIDPHQKDDDSTEYYENIVKKIIEESVLKTNKDLLGKSGGNGKLQEYPILKSLKCDKSENKILSILSKRRLKCACDKGIFTTEFVNFLEANNIYGIQCHGEVNL